MMYLDYLKEREDKDSICSVKGFVVYKIHGENCHIYEAYTAAIYRLEHVATELVDKVCKIAAMNGCKTLTACVVPSLNGANESLRAQLQYGFKVTQAVNDCIILTKDI
jgi:ribosomal protein S18 acetylase RimI-like enzyme